VECKKSASVGLALIVALFLGGSLGAQDHEPGDSYWPVFLESAWGLNAGQTLLWSGVEFEEDSGDFPTFKTVLHVRHGLSDRLLVQATSMLVRFNRKATYTAWGGSNPSFGLQYRLPLPDEEKWGLQLRAEVLPAWGGFATANTCFSPGVDFSRRLGSVGLHFNGTATAGASDDRVIWPSEVDRWRVSAGYDWRPKDGGWTIMMAWIKAKPIRPKPVETTAELGLMRRLSWSWSAGAGAGVGLTEKGQEYILRFGIRYATD
jgi:hypothetical protein